MRLFSTFARRAVALAVIGAGLALSIAPAEAQWRRYKGVRPGVVAAAAVGGLAAGALIASAHRPAYAAPSYGYPQYTYAPHAGVSYYSQPTYYAPAYATQTYAPAYAAPVVRYHRPRPVYRRYASYEPVCTIHRKKVWLSHNSYTFRRVTTCR